MIVKGVFFIFYIKSKTGNIAYTYNNLVTYNRFLWVLC